LEEQIYSTELAYLLQIMIELEAYPRGLLKMDPLLKIPSIPWPPVLIRPEHPAQHSVTSPSCITKRCGMLMGKCTRHRVLLQTHCTCPYNNRCRMLPSCRTCRRCRRCLRVSAIMLVIGLALMLEEHNTDGTTSAR
jgi:hypothetical protein